MKLTKILVGSAIALPATVVPLSTITSCAQSWGNLSAFSIGGATASNGPYARFVAYPTAYLDHDGKPYMEYLQSNYSINQASNAAYAYSSPMKWNGDEDVREWELGETGWYSYGDPTFNSYASYWDEAQKKNIEKPNARNAALSTNISFVDSIGSTLSGYVSNALRYQASQVDINDDDNVKIKTAWGANEGAPFTLNYGEKPSGSLHNFFEYNFASANLNGSGRAEAMLRPANINFDFLTFPLPFYISDTKLTINPIFIANIDSGWDMASDTYYDTLTQYTQKSDPIEETIDDQKVNHINYVYKNVPIRVRVNNLTQSYLNPQVSGSFLVNDYYSTNDQVTNTIGDQWKVNLNRKTDCGEENAVPRFKTFKWITGDKSLEGEIQDPQDGRLYGRELLGNDFIILIDYSLSIYDVMPEKNVAAITGVSNIFPACWLSIFNDREDWYVKTNDDHEQYMLNSDVINQLSNKFNSIVTRSAAGQLPTDEEDLKLLRFLGYMFADNSNEILISDGSVGALEPLDII